MSIVGGFKNEGGAESLFSIAKLLADPAALEAEYKRLQVAKDEAQKLVDLVGPAHEVLALRDEVKADLKAAQDALAEAKKTAAKIVADAKEEALNLVAKGNVDLERANQQADAVYKACDSKLAKIEALRADVEKSLEDARNRENAAQAAEEAFLEAKAETEAARQALDEKRQLLQDGAEGIAGLLKHVYR